MRTWLRVALCNSQMLSSVRMRGRNALLLARRTADAFLARSSVGKGTGRTNFTSAAAVGRAARPSRSKGIADAVRGFALCVMEVEDPKGRTARRTLVRVAGLASRSTLELCTIVNVGTECIDQCAYASEILCKTSG